MMTKKIILAIVALAICTFIKAQDLPAKKLVGTWTFLEAPSINKMDNAIKQSLASNTEVQGHLSKYYTGRQLSFGADGSYLISFSTGESYTGKWASTGTTLTMITPDNITAIQQLVFHDDNHFHVTTLGVSDLMLNEIHYTRN